VVKLAAHTAHDRFPRAYKRMACAARIPTYDTGGVLGLSTQWSAATRRSTVMLAFTRLLADHGFHAGGFNNVTAAAFESRNRLPMVMGTRLTRRRVVISKPFMVADHPGLRQSEELEFCVPCPPPG